MRPNALSGADSTGMAPTTPAVSVRDLERRFGSFVAVNRVSFDVAPGEIFGFLGPNGAGKSTTIRMLTGILTPTGGAGTVAGFDIRREPERIKTRIGYMSQRFSLYDDLTVEENLDFFAGIYRVPKDRRAARKAWAIEMAGLADARHARTSTLPGGLKQRLALGSAVLHEPPILFLDEPTSGVDPINRRRFWDLIHSLADAGVTVFVTTHYMDEAEYCDRLALIYRGELVALGTPDALKTDAMRDRVLEIQIDRPQDAAEAVAAMAGVTEAAPFGEALHVVVPDAERMTVELRAALGAQGYAVGRVEIVPPSLEDVFVWLLRARDRADERREEGR